MEDKMETDENDLSKLKKQYLEQHIEFVQQTLQKTRGTRFESLWKHMYECITTDKRMNKESIQKMHTKLASLKQKSQERASYNERGEHKEQATSRTRDADPEKRSVSPIRFPRTVEETSEITTIIYQKFTSTESSRDPRLRKDPRFPPPRLEEESSASHTIPMIRDERDSRRQEKRWEKRRRSRSQSFSISPTRDRRRHRESDDRVELFYQKPEHNFHKSSRSSHSLENCTRHDSPHVSSRSRPGRDELYTRRREQHSSSKYERNVRGMDELRKHRSTQISVERRSVGDSFATAHHCPHLKPSHGQYESFHHYESVKQIHDKKLEISASISISSDDEPDNLKTRVQGHNSSGRKSTSMWKQMMGSSTIPTGDEFKCHHCRQPGHYRYSCPLLKMTATHANNNQALSNLEPPQRRKSVYQPENDNKQRVETVTSGRFSRDRSQFSDNGEKARQSSQLQQKNKSCTQREYEQQETSRRGFDEHHKMWDQRPITQRHPTSENLPRSAPPRRKSCYHEQSAIEQPESVPSASEGLPRSAPPRRKSCYHEQSAIEQPESVPSASEGLPRSAPPRRKSFYHEQRAIEQPEFVPSASEGLSRSAPRRRKSFYHSHNEQSAIEQPESVPSASEGLPRSAPQRRKSCYHEQSAIEQRGEHREGRSQKTDEDVNRSHNKRRVEAKASEMPGQERETKKLRMSCFHQPEETQKSHKSRRLSSESSEHSKYNVSSTNKTPKILPKMSSSYRIPKLSSSADPEVDDSRSYDETSLLTKVKDVAEMDLPKENKAENLVSKLKKVLGDEQFLMIQSLLVEKSGKETTEAKSKEGTKVEAGTDTSSQQKVKKPKLETPVVETQLCNTERYKTLAELLATSRAKKLEGKEASKLSQDADFEGKTSKKLSANQPTTAKRNVALKSTSKIPKSDKKPEIEVLSSKKPAPIKEPVRYFAAKSTKNNSKVSLKETKAAECLKSQKPTSSKTEVPLEVPKKVDETNEKTKKKKKLNELDRLHLDISEMHERDGILCGYKPRNCTQSGKSKIDSINKEFKLREFSIPLVKLNLTRTKGMIQLSHSFFLKNPSIKSFFEVSEKKQDEDEKHQVVNISLLSSEDSLEQEPARSNELKPNSTVIGVPKNAVGAKKKAAKGKLRKRRLNWSNGNIVKKIRKKKMPQQSEDEWEDIVPEPKVETSSEQKKMRLDALVGWMKKYEKDEAKIDKVPTTLTDTTLSASTKSINVPARVIPNVPQTTKSAEAPKTFVSVKSNTAAPKVCGLLISNQNISFNAEKKLKCELCSFGSMNTGEFLQHLKNNHPLQLWSQFCNICHKKVKESDQNLASELSHLLTHMTYSALQTSSVLPTDEAKPFLKLRELPGDKLSVKAASSSSATKPLTTVQVAPPLPLLVLQDNATTKCRLTTAVNPLNVNKQPATFFYVADPSPVPPIAKPSPVPSITNSLAIETRNSLRPWIKTVVNNKANKACQEMLQSNECLAALFKCMGSNCSYWSNDQELFKKHLGLHEQFQPRVVFQILRCPYCNCTTPTIDGYLKHVVELHGFDRFQCGLCFYRAYNDFNVFKHHHQAYHSGRQPLVIHVKPDRIRLISSELENIKKNNIPAFVPQLKCFICKTASFLVIKTFMEHLEKHPEENKLKCVKCGLSSEKMSSLKHFFTCYGYGNFQCVYCTFGTNTFAVLGDHIAERHSSQMPFFCERIQSSTKSCATDDSAENHSFSGVAIKQICMTCKTVKRVEMQDKPLLNAENVKRLSEDFIAPEIVTVVDIDEHSQFSIVPVDGSILSNSGSQLQIQNVMTLFDIPAEKFIGNDLDDMDFYDFDA